MRHPRTTALAIGLITSSLFLAGCGDSGTPQKAGETTEETNRIAAVTDEELTGTTISLARMFGDCEETTTGVTDTAKATNECEAIQILTNKFNAENKYGITVERLGGSDWNSYYDAFNASIAGSEPANIANLHDYALSDYASRDQLLAFDPAEFGIDLSDATEAAVASVAWDGQTYAVPFDSHAILAHINTDMLDEAGYLDDDGRPIMPTTGKELMAMGAAVKEATGKYLFSMGFANDDMAWRVFYSLVRQQGVDLIDGDTVNIDTPESKAALNLMNEMIAAEYIHIRADYSGSISEWFAGESAMLVNGTWAVNEYAATAPFGYTVVDFPTVFDEPAVWASSHMWVLPRQSDDDPVKYRAAIEFAAFLYENTNVWSTSTGHFSPRVSVIESDEYQNAPERANYTETALKNIRFVPQIKNWTSVKDLVHNQLEEVWFNGKDVEAALAEAQARVEQELN
ncbi:extracellular solute-binding protein [Tessaracoccus sp.]